MNRYKGILLVALGSIFWGATGPMMEWIIHNTEMSAQFMLAVRLIIAGVGILCILKMKKQPVFTIWKEATWRWQLLIFSFIGMLGLQVTFVKTIESSDAVIATLLQFLSPILIIIYLFTIHKKMPPIGQIIGILGTLIGLFLLLTNGSTATLQVSKETLIWGLGLSFTYAFYTLYPARLQAKWGVLLIVAWGMLLSGVALAIYARIWSTDEWQLLGEPKLLILVISLAILGASAFILYLSSIKYLSAVVTNVLSTIEPLTAMIISAIWFQSFLKQGQFIGAIILLLFVAYLSLASERKSE